MRLPKTAASAPTAKAGSCHRSDRLSDSEMEWLANDHRQAAAEINRLWQEAEARDQAKAKPATIR